MIVFESNTQGVIEIIDLIDYQVRIDVAYFGLEEPMSFYKNISIICYLKEPIDDMTEFPIFFSKN